MATVCVCIPTRNRAAYVKQTLASVLVQTAQDFRVIVSDDASERAAAAEVEAHVNALADPRVSYHYHPHNLQEYDHGRFLFGQCAEEFFAVLHDDDLWEPTFLQSCLAVLVRDPSLACVTTNQFVIDGSGTRNERMTAAYQQRMGRDRYREGRLHILEPLLRDSLFALSCTVFRTATLQRSGLVDAECHGNAVFDINLFLRLGERDEAAYYLPQALAAYRIHDDRLSVTEERGGFNPRLLETLMAVLAQRRFSGRAEKERRRQLAAAYHNYAVICYLRHDTAGMYKYLWRCVSTRPGRWQNWAYVIFAVFPFLIKPVFGSRVPPATSARAA
jgi:glycosyltransferase involved in cell wall biosynthesis